MEWELKKLKWFGAETKMTDDDFMNIGKKQAQTVLPKESGVGGTVPKQVVPTPSPETHQLNRGNVIIMKMMTMVEWRIYPNGQRSHPISKTWFTNKEGEIVNKKKPKKVLKVKAAKIEETEAY